MTAGNLDLFCTRGSEFSSEITVKNPDNTLAWITNWASRMHVRRLVSSDDVVVELTTSNGRITHDRESAKILLSISASDTSLLEAGNYVYDLEMYHTIATGVIRLIKGNFIVG